MSVKLVVDHVRGARRGQRQILDRLERVSFGRHPNNSVAFDAQADIDASSQHAELVAECAVMSTGEGKLPAETNYVLRDIGSSNGTWIGGNKVARIELALEQAIEVEFGSGGPIVRLWLGATSPPAPLPACKQRWWRKLLPW